MNQFFQFISIPVLAAIVAALIMFGLLFYFWQDRMEKRARSEVKKRLDISKTTRRSEKSGSGNAAERVASKMATKTDQFYSAQDPEQKRKMQMRLISAGYASKSALGYFFAARIVLGLAMLAIGVLLALTSFAEASTLNKALVILLFGCSGYFYPNFHVNRRIKTRVAENRAGFPDVLDLMVVCAEAGLTTEASIERIAQEIRSTYVTLSEHLTLAAVEIRAGKPLDEALRAFGDRVGLEEVQGFATMIQQSKELGTSVSDALRIYSDEMRHKRMMVAEEKAYALPAKLSIPVTAFILPIVIGVAVTPTVVRLTSGG